MNFAIKERLIIGAKLPKDWDSSLIPSKRRRMYPISFEFVDLSVQQAFAAISKISSVNIEFGKSDRDSWPEIDIKVNLRVTDMRTEFSIGWVCRIADINSEFDEENQKFVIT